MSKRSPKSQLQQETPTELQEVELLSGQRQKSESDKAIIACNEWLRMGPGRSLSDLLERLTDTNQITPITGSLGTLKHWSTDYGWMERARAYDATWEARKTAEREAVLGYGLAHDYERVRKLYRLAAMLEAQMYERGMYGDLHNLWVPDVKSIGSGEFAERVDIERFNSPLIEQYRKVLEDIAKETGGRVQRQEISGAGGAPFTFEIKTIEYRAAIPPPTETGSIPDRNPSSEGESVGDGETMG